VNTLKEIIEYIRWPIISGLVVALSAIVLFPQHFAIPNTGAQKNDAAQRDWRGPVSYSQAVEKASNSVVSIYTLKQVEKKRHPLFDDPIFRLYFNIADIPRQQRMQSSLGSGVIVSENGHILTNQHVIQGADEIIVALQDGREAAAVILGKNDARDLAVLKIDLANLQAIEIDTSTPPRVGDVALAIGNPFGLGQTVTQGIVSATRARNMSLNISKFENFIQTDAEIHPGNSGGALVDVFGRLIGINTANLDNTGLTGGISFAIPVEVALPTLNDIVEFGRVRKGWLGVEAEQLSRNYAEQLGLDSPSAILITGIWRNSPAEIADIRPQDIIVGIDEDRIDDPILAWQRIQESRPGDELTIKLLRNGQIVDTKVVLEERPAGIE